MLLMNIPCNILVCKDISIVTLHGILNAVANNAPMIVFHVERKGYKSIPYCFTQVALKLSPVICIRVASSFHTLAASTQFSYLVNPDTDDVATVA